MNMTKPAPLEGGASFPLPELTKELREDPAYARVGHAARTLVRTADLRVVVVALAQGHTIAEHRAGATASVQTLSGNITLQLPDRREEVAAGQLLVLGPGLRHDVQAKIDSTFLLTLGWPSTRPASGGD